MADETIPFPKPVVPEPAPPEPEPELGATSNLFEVAPPLSAVDRLRAFEDEHLGEDAPRQAGQVEKGHGSLFQRLSPEKRKAHIAIEKTVETEQKLASARAALLAAENEHAQACAAADGR